MDERYDIVIVGAGPGGLVVENAAGLATTGVQCG